MLKGKTTEKDNKINIENIDCNAINKMSISKFNKNNEMKCTLNRDIFEIIVKNYSKGYKKITKVDVTKKQIIKQQNRIIPNVKTVYFD